VAIRVIEVTATSKLQLNSIYLFERQLPDVPHQILCAARRNFTKRKYVLLLYSASST